MYAVKHDPLVDIKPDSLCAYREGPVAQLTSTGEAMCTRNVLIEEPLSIRVQGRPYAVVMRTPGDEIAHAAGFCLGEGIIDRYDEIKQIACCETGDTDVVTVTLNAARLFKAGPILERRGFISQSSCGVCGKEMIRDLVQTVQPLQDALYVKWDQLLTCVDRFNDHQSLYGITHTSHAAVAFDSDFQPLAAGEDVGRHNAVDKVVGKLLLSGGLEEVTCLVLSSRISYELIQKAGRARIPIIVAFSRPTTLAVELADRLNISLVHVSSNHRLIAYNGIQRIIHA